MTAPLAYVDTSALVKLAAVEAETPSLEHDLVNRRGLVCSRLGATELRRACARVGKKRLLAQVDEVLDAVFLLEVTPAILETAGRLSPSSLRTLDAIHLSTMLGLTGEPLELVTYDDRLASAARAHNIPTVMPGRR